MCGIQDSTSWLVTNIAIITTLSLWVHNTAIGARERDDGRTVEDLLTISGSVQRFDNGPIEIINIVSSENAVVLTPIVDLVMCGGEPFYITLHVLFF